MCLVCAITGRQDHPGWNRRDDALQRVAHRLNGPSLTADDDAAVVLARYEAWREIERAVSAEERRAKAYERLERELRAQ